MLNKIKNYLKKPVAIATMAATLVTSYPAIAKDVEFIIPKANQTYSKLVDAIKSKVKDQRVKDSIDNLVNLIYVKQKKDDEKQFDVWALQDDGNNVPEAGIDTSYSDPEINSYQFTEDELRQAGLPVATPDTTVVKPEKLEKKVTQDIDEVHFLLNADFGGGNFKALGRKNNRDTGSVSTSYETLEKHLKETEKGRALLKEAKEKSEYWPVIDDLRGDDSGRYVFVQPNSEEWQATLKALKEGYKGERLEQLTDGVIDANSGNPELIKLGFRLVKKASPKSDGGW